MGSHGGEGERERRGRKRKMERQNENGPLESGDTFKVGRSQSHSLVHCTLSLVFKSTHQPMPRSKHSNLSCSRTPATPEVCNNWGYDYTNNNTDMDTNMKNMSV